jgi:hypothetical protein
MSYPLHFLHPCRQAKVAGTLAASRVLATEGTPPAADIPGELGTSIISWDASNSEDVISSTVNSNSNITSIL